MMRAKYKFMNWVESAAHSLRMNRFPVETLLTLLKYFDDNNSLKYRLLKLSSSGEVKPFIGLHTLKRLPLYHKIILPKKSVYTLSRIFRHINITQKCQVNLDILSQLLKINNFYLAGDLLPLTFGIEMHVKQPYFHKLSIYLLTYSKTDIRKIATILDIKDVNQFLSFTTKNRLQCIGIDFYPNGKCEMKLFIGEKALQQKYMKGNIDNISFCKSYQVNKLGKTYESKLYFRFVEPVSCNQLQNRLINKDHRSFLKHISYLPFSDHIDWVGFEGSSIDCYFRFKT